MISVAVLEDHQSIIDGYLYRLAGAPDIRVLSSLNYGEDLEPVLAKHPIDVLILDVHVPTSASNRNPYPILHLIPTLLQKYPHLYILVISMDFQRTLIKSVMEVGGSGYILKDDQASIRSLPSVIRTIAEGGVYLSKEAEQLLKDSDENFGSLSLSARQLQALSLSAAYPDASSAELASKMNVANSTVRNLLSGAYLKLDVHNRAAAIVKARQSGLIATDPPAPDVSPLDNSLD